MVSLPHEVEQKCWDPHPRSALCRRLDDDCEVSQELFMRRADSVIARGLSDNRQSLHDDGFYVGENLFFELWIQWQ